MDIVIRHMLNGAYLYRVLLFISLTAAVFCI